jgi:hypothetical protein
LFPYLKQYLPVFTQKHRQLAVVLELIRIEEHLSPVWMQVRGRKSLDRGALARAFVAKSICNIATTKALRESLLADDTLRQMCGFASATHIPSESTFSRAFAEFANSALADIVHERLVKAYMGEELVWHISRDSTAIVAREKALPKQEKQKKKRGRPAKADPPVEPKRIFKQLVQTPEQAIVDLPKACDIGVKKDAKGHRNAWKGYKFHVDVADKGIPISAITTSASVHDSQVAIPLAKTSANRVQSLYDLMDTAYDAQTIHEVSHLLGHVPIINPAPIPGGGKKPPLEPDRALRYRNRTSSERFNSHLKDNRGGRNIRVAGHAKVHAHLMFGVLVIFAEAILGLLA